jgi:plastocyanin
MIKIIIPSIFLVILVVGSNHLVASAQENEFTITLNPGATNRDSQNPMSPSANITIPAGTNVTWINNDISPHMLVSGTPEEGPDNIFYGSFFGAGENYTVTFDEPGLYSYYDPVSSHLRGIITVENPGFSSDQGLNIDTSSAGGTDNNLAVGSNTSDVVGSSINNFNASDRDFASFPSSSSSSLPSFPSFTTDNTSNQSSILSSIVSDQTLKNIIKKVGPLIGILMGGSDSSSHLSSTSPLSSSFPQSNESFGVRDSDNQSSIFPSTTQTSESHHTLANIFNKIGPLLSLLMNGNNSSSGNMDDGRGLSAFFSNETNDTYDNSSSLSATKDFGTGESIYAPS